MSDEQQQDVSDGAFGPERRTGRRRLIPTWRMLVGALLLVLLVLSGGFVVGYLLVGIPAANAAAVAESNVYLYSDGTQLARKGEVNRENVPLAKVPRHTQRAVLAAEDRDFHHESAVDFQAMIRAGWNMLTGGSKQSGSTITQQYVKNYYLNQEQTLSRKAKEFFIAIKLDNEAGKDEILRGYLNTSYFGRNTYGIQAAADAYYGKPAAELTVAESAYLASLLNAPSAYDTRAHPENRDRAVARWNYVLDGMVEEGWLSQADRRGMEFPEPGPDRNRAGLSGQRGYLVRLVDEYLIDNEVVSEQRLAGGGFRITTTIDRKKQHALVEAVNEKLVSRLSEEREEDAYVRAGATSIEPASGKVVAMYGGIGYTQQYVSNAVRRDYQVGSTFKPFVFTAALQHESRTRDGERITPDTVYDGTSGRTVIGPDGPTDFAPENEDQRSYGNIPVTEAMNRSVNAVFGQMGVDVGPERIKDTAIALGIPSDTPGLATSQGAISLGTATASTLDMAEAYASLAAHGKHTPHILVEKVTGSGKPVEVPMPDSERAVQREAADTTTEVLRGVVDDSDGTGYAAREADRPAAGKTGTAEEDKAAWFAGYTPQLATVVAVLGQDPETGGQRPLYGALGLPRINGGGPPTEIWAAYTKAALKGTPVKDFDLRTMDRDEPEDRPGNDGPERTEEPEETPESDQPEETTAPPTSDGPTDTAPPTSSEPSEPAPSTSSPTAPPTKGTPTPPPGPDGGTDGGGTDSGGTTSGGADSGGGESQVADSW